SGSRPHRAGCSPAMPPSGSPPAGAGSNAGWLPSSARRTSPTASPSGPAGRLPLLIAPTNEPAWFGPWPAVSRDRHTVLLHGGDWPAPDQAQLVRAGAVPFPLDRPVAGALARALGPAPSAVVVRPDGHLHARLVHADAGRVAAVVREARAGGPPGGPDPAARRRPALRPRRVAGPRG